MCADLANWGNRYDSFPAIAINPSPIQLRDENCTRRICAILERSGVDARQLEFEITETSLLSKERTVLATIGALQAFGARICLDDFGAGYSSLSHLQSLPLDTMKLDRNFVFQLGDPRTHCICEGIIHLGQRLGLKIVGEGAETDWQYQELVRMGCNEVPGYYLSRPLNLDQLEALFADHPKKHEFLM